MKNGNDNLMIKKLKIDLNYTSVGAKSSGRKTFSTITLPSMADDIQNRTFEEIIGIFDGLEGQGIQNNIIPPNIIDE